MSRRANSGWLFGSESRVHTVVVEGDQCTIFPIVRGQDLRESEVEALAGERADYFIERLLVRFTAFWNPDNAISHTEFLASIRVGTIAEFNQPPAEDALLMSGTNAEFWSRILYDCNVAAYEDPALTFEGGALAVDETVTADRRKNMFMRLGPSHFDLDIQQRFSLQREEDDLVVAFGADPQWAAVTGSLTLSFTWKALVKEYRK